MHKLFAYPGGKWPIRKTVVGCFPQHTTYVDVFGGSAAILLTKEPSRGEVFNDKNQEIVNFFRVVKHRPAELAERSRTWIHSRKFFTEHRDSTMPMDELERAFRFWVLLADSFGARGLHYGMAKGPVHSVTHAREHLQLVAERLKDVHVECLDFLKVISLYDAPDTFFYLDPPYRNTKGGSSNYDLLTDEEWKVMHDTLRKIKGKFLLSSNDDAFVLGLFRKFPTRHIKVPVTLSNKSNSERRSEILVSNYTLPTRDVRRKKFADDAPPARMKRSQRQPVGREK